MRNKLLIAILLSGLFGSLSSGVLAQQQTPSPDQPKEQPKGNFKKRVPTTGLKELEKPPEIPGIDFPKTPAKFLYGYTNAQPGGKARLGARFDCPEPPSQIVNYYANALKMQGWEILETKATGCTAVFPKSKAAIEISCEAHKRTAGCTVLFGYCGPPTE